MTSAPVASMDPTTRPPALPVQPKGIPQELTALAQWVCWDWIWDGDRADWTKPPLNPRTGGKASATDPTTWTDFPTALATMQRCGYAGVGFVVSRDDPFTGIDLDRCRDRETGELQPWAAEIVAHFDSYTEVSPSGTGLRIWITGTLVGLLPDGKEGTKAGPIEAYSGKKYLTVTGHVLREGQS